MTRRKKLIIAGSALALVVVAGVVVALSGGGGSPHAVRPTTTLKKVTTTSEPPPIAPLTGLPDPTGESQKRPALAVKVENTPPARPQAGLDQADVVYEEEVEGGITRFLAIFNSAAPQTIGPVRSVRLQDPDIVWPIGGIFAFSGGAADPLAAIKLAPVHVVDNNVAVANGAGAMERDAPGQPPRKSPHNLYGHGPQLFALGGTPVPPPPLFQYAPPGADPAPGADGVPVVSMHVGFQHGYDVTYNWDASTNTWKRFQLGAPHLVVGDHQIAPANVVVQFTQYSGVSNAQTVGEGDVWIFSDGRLRKGRWVRPTREQPARYVDAIGRTLFLRPGQTWVELLPASYAVAVVEAPPTTTIATTPKVAVTTKPSGTK